MGNSIRAEGGRIFDVLVRDMPKMWEGQPTVLALREAKYNWKQMEWIGFHNEMKSREVVRAALRGDIGPSFGKTAFDYRCEWVWDFKVHPAGIAPWTVLNDQEAIDRCIAQYGAVGFVVTLGTAKYDDAAGTFKKWHDLLKGVTSKYELDRISREAPSRRRKVGFQVTGFVSFVFDGPDVPRAGLREGWLRLFQKGMRNSNGRPRRAKYMINVDAVPQRIVIARRSV